MIAQLPFISNSNFSINLTTGISSNNQFASPAQYEEMIT